MESDSKAYLAKPFRLSVLLEAERREVAAIAEYLGLGQDTHAANTVKLHLHVGVAVRVSKVRQMRPVRRVLGIALHNDGVLVERVGKR